MQVKIHVETWNFPFDIKICKCDVWMSVAKGHFIFALPIVCVQCAMFNAYHYV